MNGILLFDKPVGWTSHDAVDFVRRRAGQRAVGHAGTLDPLATGLLVLLLGKATKLSSGFMELDKDYEGSIRLGVETDTLDMEGKVVNTGPWELPEADVARAFEAMKGEQMQTPPAYSAIKVAGKKSYDLARAGTAAVLEPRKITVAEFRPTGYAPPESFFFVSCSKGTYVRSLAAELGRRLGTVASLSSLRRLRVGPYPLHAALNRSDLESVDAPQLEARLVQR
jgi:tRNA pseudouridine55 synthase